MDKVESNALARASAMRHTEVLNMEEVMTSGFAKTSDKTRIIETFHRVVLPALLERAGWTKCKHDDGRTLFVPKGISLHDGHVGVDYYDRIIDVIDRINERRDEAESSIADTYRREMSRPTKIDSNPQQTPRTRRKGSGRKAATIVAPGSSPGPGSSKLDLSWKEQGQKFPKKRTNVGDAYQVSSFFDAGSYEYELGASGELLFDPKLAEEKGINLDEDVLKYLPPGAAEQALFLLAEKEYEIEAWKDAIADLRPSNGSDWDAETRKKFASIMFQTRKDLKMVATELEIPMQTCLAYYLGSFKASDYYRLLKTVCNDERLERTAALENGSDACVICGDGGNLLICDGCEGEYHVTCVRPPLQSVPEGDWECDECVDRRFLAARDFLLRTTSLFETNRKRKIDGVDDATTSHAATGHITSEGTMAHVPVQPVFDAVHEFAKSVKIALANR